MFSRLKKIFLILSLLALFVLPAFAQAKDCSKDTELADCGPSGICEGSKWVVVGEDGGFYTKGQCKELPAPNPVPGSNSITYCYDLRESETSAYTRRICIDDQKKCDLAAKTADKSHVSQNGCYLVRGLKEGIYDLTQDAYCYQAPGSPTPTCGSQAECQSRLVAYIKANPADKDYPTLKCTKSQGMASELTANDSGEDQCIYGAVVPRINMNACLKQLFAWSASVLLWLLGRLLWLAMQIFNISFQIGILDFHYFANSEAITTIWGIGRDLANIFFIFILMYIAIMTITQGGGVNTQQLVVQLIITALLINFSILIPRVVIDVSNSMANIFYQKMGEPGVNGAPDVAGVLIAGLSPQSFFGAELKQRGVPIDNSTAYEAYVGGNKAGNLSWSTIIVKSLGVGILIFMLSYYLLVAAYLFLARTVTLIVIIASSALAFFSRIIPQGFGAGGYWKQWTSALILEAFYAPIFMFLLYMVLLLASNPIPEFGGTVNKNPAPNGSAVMLTAQANNTAAPSKVAWGMDIIWYLTIIGLAMASLKVTSSMSKWSAFVSQKVAKSAVGQFAARNTIGRAGSAIGKSDAMQRLQSKMPSIGGFAKGWSDKMADVGGFQKTTQKYAAQNAAFQSSDLKFNHLMNLNSAAQLETYSKMDAKTRADMFKEADKISDPVRKQAAIARLNTLREEDNKRLVTGRSAEKSLQDEQFGKKNDEKERLEYLLNPTVNKSDRERLLKSLEPGDRLKLMEYVEQQKALDPDNSALDTLSSDLVAARTEIEKNKNEKQKMARADKSYARTKEADKLVSTDREERSDAIARADQIIPRLTGNELTEFMKDNPNFFGTNQFLVKHITVSQLSTIGRSDDIESNEKKVIADAIKNAFQAAPAGSTERQDLQRKVGKLNMFNYN